MNSAKNSRKMNSFTTDVTNVYISRRSGFIGHSIGDIPGDGGVSPVLSRINSHLPSRSQTSDAISNERSLRRLK